MPCLVNVDFGERSDEPVELASLAHLANIACGGHAGDPPLMSAAVRAAIAAGATLSAHVSYPDRAGFGRRSIPMPPAVLAEAIAGQIRALLQIAGRHPVEFVKPHGALWHDAHRDPVIARAIIAGTAAALGPEFTLVGAKGGALEREARARGLGYLREGLADRGRREDGSWIPRGEPGAMVHDPALAAAQAVALAADHDTICVHGDGPNALEIARAVRAALEAPAG